MLLSLVSVIALASSDPGNEIFVCEASFSDAGRYGSVQLVVDADYTPRSLTVRLLEPDGWSRAEIALDPTERRLPGLLSHAFFAVRYTRVPAFPLTMNAYADGALRWRRHIRVPFWPTTLADSAGDAREAASHHGTVDYVARADDGLPVPTPHELKVVLVDASGQQVGESRYTLPGGEQDGPAATALAAVDTGFRTHRCSPPPPPID